MSSLSIAACHAHQQQLTEMFSRLCSHFPAGAAAFAALNEEDKPFGLFASRFMPVSLQPAVIAVCVDSTAFKSAGVSRITQFSLSLLRDDQVQEARDIFGPRETHPETLPWTYGLSGVPAIRNALTVLFCRVNRALDLGLQQVLIAEVQDFVLRGGEPLVSWRNGFYKLDLDYPHLASSTTLEQFVRDWEKGLLPRSLWNHAAHMTIIAYYAFDGDTERAYQRMKAGILYYNLSVGIRETEDSGYHETLTRFWTNVVSDFVHCGCFSSRLQAVQNAVKVFGSDRDLYRLYYSFDVKRDRRSRREYVIPDRQGS